MSRRKSEDKYYKKVKKNWNQSQTCIMKTSTTDLVVARKQVNNIQILHV